MYCNNCGTEVPESAKFCQSCGWRLAAAEQAAAVSPDPAPPAPAPPAPVTAAATAATAEPAAPAPMFSAPTTPDEAEELIRLGYELFDMQRLDEARAAAVQVLNADFSSSSARYLLSLVLERKGDLQASIRQMQIVVSDNPRSQADVARLNSLRDKLAEKNKIASGVKQPPTVQRRVFDNRHAASGVLFGILVIAAVLLFMRFSGSGGESEAVVAAPPQTQQQPATGSVQTQAQRRPYDGSLFEGPPANAPSISPDPVRPVASAPVAPSRTAAPVATAPIPQPPAPRPTTPAAATAQPAQPSPAPASNRPAGTGTVTREPVRQPAERSGADYQKMAMEYQARGDTGKAVENYRLAKQAFTRQLNDPGRAREAQLGITSVNTSLRILGYRE